MAHAVYTVSPTGNGWIIRHDSATSAPYEQLDAAFEAACKAAAGMLRQGFAATVTVERGTGLDRDRRRSPIGEALVHPEPARGF